MEKSKFSYIIVVLLLVNITCSCNNSIPEYQDGLNSFKKFYNEKNIVNHFPEKVNSIRNFYCYSLSKEVNFAEIYLSANSTPNDIEILKKSNYQFVGEYNSKKFFQVSIDLIRDSSEIYILKIKDINDLIPIGNIEQTDFGLGERNDTINGTNKKRVEVISKYVVPEDLKLYVIESRCGDFFIKDVCRVKRYSLLGKWRNGFSRGIAISEKYKIITYWLITW